MKTKVFVLGLLFAIFFFYSLSYSQVPQMINYQGKLTTAAGGLLNGNYDMTFSIYDTATGGTALWTEIQDGVSVENGIFSVYLGSVNPIPFDIWGNGPRYLGVTIGTGPEMTPRKPMVSVPFSFTTAKGDCWDCITVSGVTFLVSPNDNVGIGTKNPQAKLDVTCYDSVGDSASWSWIRLNPDMAIPGNCQSVGIQMNDYRNHNYLDFSAYDQEYGNYIGTRDPTAGYGQGFGIVGGPHVAPFERFVVNTDSMFLGYAIKAGDGTSDNGPPGRGNLYVRGNAGIGTKEPRVRLTVRDSVPDPILRPYPVVHIGRFVTGYGHSAIYLGSETAGNPYVPGQFNFNLMSDGGDLRINRPAGSRILFEKNHGAWTQMVIDTGGNVGIGGFAAQNPTQKLDVDGTARLRSMPTTSSGSPDYPVYVDGNGVLFKNTSSRRYKENIRELEVDPEKALQLNPVRFQWKTTGAEDIGLIAEDVDGVIPDLVVYDNEGRPDGVKYDKVAIYLLQVVKAQQERISALEKQIAELRK